jgi:4-amino-4-deoxy-L-arabinose transferase-like glycosyltransferase
MLLNYLGTLKGLVYRGIFRIRPSLATTRIPMVLAGVATLWLLYRLIQRISGGRAAVAGCFLLAADSMFLLTNTFDWGPVAFQHLLLVGGVLLALVFYQHESLPALFGAFFLFGLGLWDKALMVWMLSGCGVAALVIFPRQILRSLRPRPILIAVFAFCLGALPLIVFNVNNHWETFRGNTTFDFTDLPNKTRLLGNTLNGQALFGWMVAEDHEAPVPRQPATLLERASFSLAEKANHRRTSFMVYGLILALLLTPLARGAELKAILFSLVAMAIAWGQMAITRNAGGSVHHAVLIWPFPHLLMAVSFASAARRLGRAAVPALAFVVALLAGSSLIVLNQYHVQAVRNGGALNFNDAIVPLNDYLRGVRASNLFCVDWGILDSLRLLSRGRLPVRVGSDPVSKPQLSAEDLEVVRGWVKEPDHVFVAHTEGNEFFTGTSAKLQKIATEMGYQRDLMQVIGDRYGRKVFEVYRFRSAEHP